MKRIRLICVVLLAFLTAVLLTGCNSTAADSKGALQCAGDEVVLAGHQAACAGASFGSLGAEVTLPLWFIAGD